MKTFPTDFAALHGDSAIVCYRFNCRFKDDPDYVRVNYVVGNSAQLQSYADSYAQNDNVLSAACEYQYSIDIKHVCRIIAIKSEDEPAEEV